MFVYLIYHPANNCYIGSTRDFEAQLKQHPEWSPVLVLDVRAHRQVLKRWNEGKLDLHSKVLRGLQLGAKYKAKIYLSYDAFEQYRTNNRYHLPESIWTSIMKP